MRKWKLDPARDLGLSGAQRSRSLQRESGLVESFLHWTWLSFLRNYFRLYHRMSVEGKEYLPAEPPFVIVANHSSHLDAPALMSALPRRLCDQIFPVAAGEYFFETAGSSFFASAVLNALPIWRRVGGAQTMASLRVRLLDEPCAYVLFPEGTRSRTGEIGQFRAGLGMLVAGTDVPVVPACIGGAFAAFPPHRKLPVPRKLTLRFGEPVQFRTRTNDRAGWIDVARHAEESVRLLAHDV